MQATQTVPQVHPTVVPFREPAVEIPQTKLELILLLRNERERLKEQLEEAKQKSVLRLRLALPSNRACTPLSSRNTSAETSPGTKSQSDLATTSTETAKGNRTARRFWRAPNQRARSL